MYAIRSLSLTCSFFLCSCKGMWQNAMKFSYTRDLILWRLDQELMACYLFLVVTSGYSRWILVLLVYCFAYNLNLTLTDIYFTTHALTKYELWSSWSRTRKPFLPWWCKITYYFCNIWNEPTSILVLMSQTILKQLLMCE